MIEALKSQLAAKGSIDLIVRVRPSAAKTQLKGFLEDGSMKVDIAAPAEDGRGNDGLARLLAEMFEVDVSFVKILSGKTSRMKLVRIMDGRPRNHETKKPRN